MVNVTRGSFLLAIVALKRLGQRKLRGFSALLKASSARELLIIATFPRCKIGKCLQE